MSILAHDMVTASSVITLRKMISGFHVWRVAGRVWVAMSLAAVMATVLVTEVVQGLGLSAVSGGKVATSRELSFAGLYFSLPGVLLHMDD